MSGDALLLWGIGATFLLFIVGLIFGAIDVRFGSELYRRPSWRSTWPPWLVEEPWVVIAFMTGGRVNRMIKHWFYAGYEKATQDSCAECRETLAGMSETWRSSP